MTIADAPQRKLARTALHTSLAVDAGAGSGKTSVLVDRVVNLLLDGVPPGRIAAITFTERAAGELQERVFDRLEARFRQSEGSSRDMLRMAVAHLTDMQVSTVHAFCLWMLRTEALETGWAPGTALVGLGLEPPVMDAAFSDWWRQFDTDHPELALDVRLASTGYSLKAGAQKLVEYRDLDPHHGPPTLDWTAAHEELRRLVRRLANMFQMHCHKKVSCKLYLKNIDAVNQWRALLETQPFGDAATLAFKWHNGLFDQRGGRQADWSVGVKTDVRPLMDEIRAWQKRWAARRWGPVHRAVVRHMHTHLLPDVDARKRAVGQAEFSDLLFRAARVLVEQPSLRRHMAGRFDAILIDEVQDTDPLQAEIAMLLSRDAAQDGHWDAHPPVPGRLFAVGDPKQSIYRFRRADVSMWHALSAAITEDAPDQTVALAQNFRSTPPLVAWINHTFDMLPDYQPQVAFRPAAPLDPVVVLDVRDRQYTKNKQQHIDALVRHLTALKAGGAQVADRETGQLRDMVWGDVMVLLPAWSQAGAIHDQLLEAGIPCIVQGGTTFFARDEVRLAVAALHAITEPSAEDDIVFVLRGLFGFSLDELLRHRRAGGSWRYTIGEQPPGAITAALRVLRRLHRNRNREGYDELLSRLLEHTRAPVVWSLTPRGPSMLANIEKLRAILRDIELVARSPGEVMKLLRELARGKDEDLSLADEDADAVRITTLFKAKGLEAPVVCLPFPARGAGWTDVVFDREAGTVAVKMKALVPPDWQRLDEAEKAAQVEERRRWMYVAATRARDQLVILEDGDTGSSSLLQYDIRRGVPDLNDADHDDWLEVAANAPVRVLHPASLPAVDYETAAFPGLDVLATKLLETSNSQSGVSGAPSSGASSSGGQLSETRALELRDMLRASRSKCVKWRTVTELAAARRVRAQSVEAQPSQDGAHTVSSVGTSGGDLVHQVIHHLDLSQYPEDLASHVQSLCTALGRDMGLSNTLVATCCDITMEILQHPVMTRVREASERWQEVPFSHPDRGRIVTGTIDLCVPLDAERTRWLVIDFKTHVPVQGSRSRAQYEAQLERYAKALMATVTPCESVETALIGPFQPLVEADQPDVLELTLPCMQPGLERLLAAGVPAPVVGEEFETSAGDQLVVEWAWVEEKRGVVLDLEPEDVEKLEADGWVLAVCSELEPESIERAELAARRWSHS